MKVYVVICDSWNGEYSVKSVVAIYESEDDAKAFVYNNNSSLRGPYSDSYEYDEWEVIKKDA